MKIRSLTSLAMAAFLITACSNEEELAFTATKGMLKATVESSNPTTRVGFDTEGAFYWSTGDALGVTTSNSKNKFTKFTLSKGSGQASGTFTGRYVGTIEGYAVYPYNESHSMSGTTLTYNFPAFYTYSKVDADFFTETKGTGNSFNPAMWGSINNGSVSLKHLGGVFCIKIEKMPVTSGTLTLTSDKAIAGTFEVDLNTDNPSITSTNKSSENNTVSISFSGATAEQSGVFYVPVPTGTHDVSIKMVDNSQGEKINCVAGTFTIDRRKAQTLIVKSGSISGSEQQSVGNLSEAQSSLQSNDNVSVKNEVSGPNNTVSISSNTQSASKSLSLEKVASGASLKVSDGNSSSETSDNSVDNFTLSIPNNETTDFQPLNVTVTMPNTTVTLTGNAGAAIYGTVTSETADNTLVIGNGVEVKKVIVKKGNIRVNKGAKLVEIEKSSDYQAATVTVYKEDGAEIPSSLGEEFVVEDAAVADMNKVLKNGGTYTLSNDMEGDFVVSATTSVTINLNGHKITNKTGDTFTVNYGSSLTIEGAGTVDNVTHAKACIYNNGTVVLNGGSYERSKENGLSDTNAGGNSYYNILNHGEMTINQSVSVSQKGKFSSMIASGYYNYTDTNPRSGHVEGSNAANPKLTINGGNFSGGLNTIKNDDGATLEIKGGTFDNMSQATVQNHHVTTISGGTFNCSGAKYAVDNEGHNNAEQDKGDMTISGGTFSGLMLNVGSGADMTISGGTFSDLNVANYISENGKVVIELNNNVEITRAITLDKTGATTTIKLNNHNITNKTDFHEGGNVYSTEGFIVKSGTLNIEGEGNVECIAKTETDGYREVISAYGTSVVNLRGGSYKNYQQKNGQYDLIYAKDNAVVNIYGGTYESGGYNDRGYWVLNLRDADRNTAKINVYGGSFKNFNPCNHLCEAPNANFVAEGYQVTCDGKVTTEVHDLSGGDKTYVVSKIAQ